MLLYWISLFICGIVIIPLFSNPDVYLEEALPEEYQTEKWYKIIPLMFATMTLCPVVNTILAIYIIIQVWKILF